MSLLFDPTYPLHAHYVVSQSIWDLHEIHFWQILCHRWGKNRAFLSLQYRYEKKRLDGTALMVMLAVFLISYLIQQFMVWREQQVRQEIIDQMDEQNNGHIELQDNADQNDNQHSDGHQQPNEDNQQNNIDSNHKTPEN